jgi:hypothetical protein
MSGPSVQFSLIHSSCRRLRRWRFFIQSPRIASLFKLLDSVVSYCKSFLFSQTFFQSTYDLAGAPQGEGNRISEDFSLRHTGLEHKENARARRYILYAMLGTKTLAASWYRKKVEGNTSRDLQAPASGLLEPFL